MLVLYALLNDPIFAAQRHQKRSGASCIDDRRNCCDSESYSRTKRESMHGEVIWVVVGMADGDNISRKYPPDADYLHAELVERIDVNGGTDLRLPSSLTEGQMEMLMDFLQKRPQLKHLSLQYGLRLETAVILAAGLQRSRHLYVLTISWNPGLGDQGLTAVLYALEMHPSINYLHLAGLHWSHAGIEALSVLIRTCRELELVDARLMKVADDREPLKDGYLEAITLFARALAQRGQNKMQPVDLDVGGCSSDILHPSIGNLLGAFAKHGSQAGIGHLSLNESKLTAAHMCHIARMVAPGFSCHDLPVEGDFLGPDGQVQHDQVRGFVEARSKDDPLEVSQLPPKSALKRLSLDKNSLNGPSCLLLARALSQNDTLERLRMNDNPVGALGAAAIAVALEHSARLNALHLSSGTVPAASAGQVFDAVGLNCALHELRIETARPPEGDAVDSLCQALVKHPSMRGIRWDGFASREDPGVGGFLRAIATAPVLERCIIPMPRHPNFTRIGRIVGKAKLHERFQPILAACATLPSAPGASAAETRVASQFQGKPATESPLGRWMGIEYATSVLRASFNEEQKAAFDAAEAARRCAAGPCKEYTGPVVPQPLLCPCPDAAAFLARALDPVWRHVCNDAASGAGAGASSGADDTAAPDMRMMRGCLQLALALEAMGRGTGDFAAYTRMDLDPDVAAGCARVARSRMWTALRSSGCIRMLRAISVEGRRGRGAVWARLFPLWCGVEEVLSAERARGLVRWRHGLEAKRDAGMVFQAANEGRPLELARRLRLGKLAGGLEMEGEVEDGAGGTKLVGPLEAARLGGHDDCVRVLEGMH